MNKAKFLWIPVAIAGAVFGLTWVVMFLWNYLFPAIAPLAQITFWQAMALLVLSKILFGGFKGGGHKWKNHRHLSEEEKAQMKDAWEKCRKW